MSAEASIDEFVERTKTLLEKMRVLWSRRLMGIFPYNLSDELASKIIKASYYASMTGDEGRWPRVALHACGSEGSPKHIASLNPPVIADPVSIAKLAHTATDWCSLGCAEADGGLVIVGIIPSMSVHLGTFVTQNAKPFSSFKVAIRGPGNIDVICEKGVMTYKAGVILEYQSILTSKVLERLAAIMDSRVASLLGAEFQVRVEEGVEKRLAKIDNPAIAGLFRKRLVAEIAADSKTQLVISELVWRISEMGHGGILIITDKPESSTISYKYRVKAGRLQSDVVRYWKAAHADGYGTTRVAPSQSPGITLVHEGMVLRECLAATAQLAGTDGAIVLGTDFSLHGFGAIINKVAVDESKVTFTDGAGYPVCYDDILKNKGTRHQSALSFVTHEEETVVFVVSQDGHVTIFENQHNVVRVERGYRADGV